ncbi:uncharacterized protein LOC105202724 isoform X2 [Solenopsis invicta]|uniref:uncharacterized protein LOC105202724 isoform X2 n=1 Tax=Solenopsis invicta TaxID=13686 RepID=UPI0005961452|nr:uncharacterized protein LOC105202724 isoform X2 [Solenopsis invicta]
MKYIFAIVQVLTLVWWVALAFPQRDPTNNIGDDSIIFDNSEPSSTVSTASTTSTTPGSTMQGTTTGCPCAATAEYNPVCGTDNVTYWNMGRFNCAKKCNPRLEIRILRSCEPYIQQSSN